jgi:hypothetical protein
MDYRQNIFCSAWALDLRPLPRLGLVTHFRKPKMKSFLPSVLLLSCVTAVQAGPLNVTLNSVAPNEVVGVRVVPVGSSNLQMFSVYAGVFNMTLTDPSTHVSMTFNTFCIDTSHEVSIGQTYQVNQLAATNPPLTNGPQMEYLFTTYLAAAMANAETAAAVQIALWALENGETVLYSSASSYAPGSQFEYLASENTGNSPLYNQILTDANTFITAAINSGGTSGYWEDASASGNSLGRGQSLIGPTAGNNPFVQAAPAPSAIVLGVSAFGTMALGAALRRRSNVAVA